MYFGTKHCEPSIVEKRETYTAFGAGTAATIAPIKTIGYDSNNYDLPLISSDSYSSLLLESLNDIKYGISKDNFFWGASHTHYAPLLDGTKPNLGAMSLAYKRFFVFLFFLFGELLVDDTPYGGLFVPWL